MHMSGSFLSSRLSASHPKKYCALRGVRAKLARDASGTSCRISACMKPLDHAVRKVAYNTITLAGVGRLFTNPISFLFARVSP